MSCANPRYRRIPVRFSPRPVYNPKKAREVAVTAIREAAAVKNNTPDLVNVALEMLVAQSLELLGFTVLERQTKTVGGSAELGNQCRRPRSGG